MSFGDERDTEPAPPVRPRHAAYVIEPIENGVEMRYVSDGAVLCRVWVTQGVATNMMAQIDRIGAAVTSHLEGTNDAAMVALYGKLASLFRDVVNGARGGSVPVPEGHDHRFLEGQN
jgi:hypothetical protein